MNAIVKFFAGRFVQTCAEIALFASVFLPYVGFFVLAVCAAAITLGWHYFERKMLPWSFSMSGIVVIFNPVFPISLCRDQWFWIDVVTAMVFLVSPRVKEFARQR